MKFDTDASGTLDVKEFAFLLKETGYDFSSAEITAIFKRLDESGDNSLDFSEVRATCAHAVLIVLV